MICGPGHRHPCPFFLPRIMTGTFIKCAFLEAHVPVFWRHFIAFFAVWTSLSPCASKDKGLNLHP
ncbi:hypothetical protein DESPIG_01206 [Desulfovibrio piger ATCC 29098]|uniref:Uncharacterized protein n=1 Tax=Desulfovibrio piger ATCC 29098 TaxID=411464 RepID=B6WT01_9BACT|nr:hypothetical protein DESPIG_01206 [Desulfovibrio piger ATCC 29098]